MFAIRTFSSLALALTLAAGLAIPLSGQEQGKDQPPRRPTPPFSSLKAERSYAIGVNIARSVQEDKLDLDLEKLFQGIRDTLTKRELALSDEQIETNLNAIQEEMSKRYEALAESNLKKAQAYLEANKAKPDIVSTRSGLQYRVIRAGKGPSPGPTDTVRVHYVGMLLDGQEFDSSRKRSPDPAQLQVGGVIPGWIEALQKMRVGDKWQLFVPPELGFGPAGSGNLIGPNELLLFEIELLAIDPVEEAPAKSDGAGKDG